MNYSAVVLAAGRGVRMGSDLPKVLHQIGGKPIIFHVVQAVRQAGIADITVVVGHGREQVKAALVGAGQEVNFVIQAEQLGTGHALMQAQKQIDPNCGLLVLAGDLPLLQAETIRELLDFHADQQAEATVLSARLDNPYGYGRIVRRADCSFARIVEEKDADQAEKMIQEINSGIYTFQAGQVFKALDRINTANVQEEYYLTDVLEILQGNQHKVAVLMTESVSDIYGINDRLQLAAAQSIMYQRKNQALMLNGVTIVDPASVCIDQEVEIGQDTVILPFTIIQGSTIIGRNCEIGPYTHINDSIIGNGTMIENSRLKQAQTGDNCAIGPFSYLRPGAYIQDDVRVGDFVEIKNSVVGSGSKIPHLSYVGDAQLGEQVNVGAGTITCNYDGYHKYETVLESGAFIGSNTNLVAPVKIGAGAVTGAGSTITRDVPAQALALERAEQRVITDWNKSNPND